MSTATAERTQLRCQNCPMVFTATGEDYGLPVPDAARATGWTVWEGTTLGGEQVKRVFCAWCAGRRPEVERPKWDARCETCGCAASDADEYKTEPFTAKDAERWKQDHECEPDVFLIQPSGEHVRRRPPQDSLVGAA